MTEFSFWVTIPLNLTGLVSCVANPKMRVVMSLSDQSMFCSVYTSHFSTAGSLGTSTEVVPKKYLVLYTVHSERFPIVSLTERYHAVEKCLYCLSYHTKYVLLDADSLSVTGAIFRCIYQA